MQGSFPNHYAFLRTARIIAQKHDFNLRFDTNAKGVTVKGGDVILPGLTSGTTQEQLDSMLADIDYIGSLHRYGDSTQADCLANLPHDKPIGWLFRLFNDERINHEAADEFMGSRTTLGRRLGDGVKQMIDSRAVAKMDPRQAASIYAALTAGAMTWDRGSMAGKFKAAMSPDARALADKVDADTLPSMLASMQDADDAHALSHHAYRLLWEDDPEQEEQKERDGDGGSEGVDGDANPFNPAHGDMEVKPGPAGGESKDGDEEEGESAKPDDSDYDYKGRPHRPPVGPTGRPVVLEPPHLVKFQQLEGWDKSAHTSRYGGWGFDEWVRDVDAKHGDMSSSFALKNAVFANKIRHHLQARSQAVWEHGHKRGKLSSKNIYRIALPDEVQTGASARIFKQKQESSILDTAVSVMVDLSGSMGGDETVYTFRACQLLAHSMYVLGIPCTINGFTTTRNPKSTTGHSTIIYGFKRWDERVTPEEMERRYREVVDHYGLQENNDATALQWAHDGLLSRGEKRKILLMQSDGAPAAYNCEGEDPYSGLIQVAKRLEADPRVDILALGIGHAGVRSVPEFYTNNYGCRDITQLETSLFNLIAKRLTKET